MAVKASAQGQIPFRALALAAAYDQVDAFQAAAAAINWPAQAAEDIVWAVRLALSLGAPLFARRLATEGTAAYPEHAELKKMARILAPPTARIVDRPVAGSSRANQAWLNSHSDTFHGQWVALKDGRLLASAGSPDKLLEMVGEVKGTSILVTLVP